MPTNKHHRLRAARAANALATWRGAHRYPDPADFSDLLADMMHYARQQGLQFSEQLRLAQAAFEAECPSAKAEGGG